MTLPGPATRIEGLRRTVADLRRSIDFYRGALGFEAPAAGPSAPAGATRLQLGGQHIDLVVSGRRSAQPLAANAPDPRFQHAAIATCDMAAAWRRLRAFPVVAISRGGPQRLPAHTGGVTAFKFRDPDGHPLELIEFPAGTGDPRWQGQAARGPTLGIDHFAVVVGDVERSVAFFADRLGLRAAGRDVNRGIEQDRLDGLDGVEVDVVSLEPLHGPRTPHLELLHYRRPRFEATAVASADTVEGDEIVCRSEPPLPPGKAALGFCDPDGHRFVSSG